MTVGGSGSSGHSQPEVGKLTWVGMRVGLELEGSDGIGEAGAVELLGVVTGGIDSVEEPLLGDDGPIGEAGAVAPTADGAVEPTADGAVEPPEPTDDGCVSTP